MYILGIHDGHNAGASLLMNGDLISSISEERISKIKNHIGYPTKSIDEILLTNNLKINDISFFIYSSKFMHSAEHLKNYKNWHSAGIKEQNIERKKSVKYLKAIFDYRKEERIKKISNHLRIDREKIFFADHHMSHASSAYFGSKYNAKDKILILTCDGAGDGISATVNIGFNNQIKRLNSTNKSASIGKIYSRVTYLLGFSPWEHEYKIMGMAPYANHIKAEELSKVFYSLIKLKKNNLNFYNPYNIESSYIYPFLKKKLELKRFDEIAAAIQLFTENLLCDWIQQSIKKTGIKKIALAGGVFMNVKANMLVSKLKEVKEIFISPSCGDESLSMGAAWLKHYELKKNRIHSNNKTGFNNLCLGNKFNEDDVKKALNVLDKKKYSIKKHHDIEKKIAFLLSENKIVARFKGRMEWGSRALGNRSILSNPSSLQNIKEINSQIKNRDFWMPFAPTILFEKSYKYIENPKNIYSPYMMIAFESTKIGKKHLCAAMHQNDFTLRPQILKKEDNQDYWKLINYFQKLTGISAVMNTSFNLHGYPIVYSPKDAIKVMKQSGLKYLAIENYLVVKK